MQTKNIAIIPARGGSKRIPRKNIKDFLGRPIINWSIEAALNCGCFDKVVVSTDDEEIASVSISCGAVVPGLRPAELADDFSGTGAVIKQTLRKLDELGYDCERACCIYATAPFVSSFDIERGLQLLLERECEFVFSVTSFASSIQRGFRLMDGDQIKMVLPENFTIRSQDLEEFWHDAAQFYWGTKEAWLNEKEIFTSKSVGLKIPRYRVQDIDTLEDWKFAELIFKALQTSKGKL